MWSKKRSYGESRKYGLVANVYIWTLEPLVVTTVTNRDQLFFAQDDEKKKVETNEQDQDARSPEAR